MEYGVVGQNNRRRGGTQSTSSVAPYCAPSQACFSHCLYMPLTLTLHLQFDQVWPRVAKQAAKVFKLNVTFPGSTGGFDVMSTTTNFGFAKSTTNDAMVDTGSGRVVFQVSVPCTAPARTGHTAGTSEQRQVGLSGCGPLPASAGLCLCCVLTGAAILLTHSGFGTILGP